jgi:endonuclease III
VRPSDSSMDVNARTPFLLVRQHLTGYSRFLILNMHLPGRIAPARILEFVTRTVFPIPRPKALERFRAHSVPFQPRLKCSLQALGVLKKTASDTSPTVMNDLERLRAKALEVHAKLCAVYGCPVPFFATRDPLSELVSSLLSHRTKNADSARAYKALRERFPSWDLVLEANTGEVQDAIRSSTWPEQKAPRIQSVLREIQKQRGDLNLEFLADGLVTDARAWLESLPGVGPKTSAAVLLFSHLRRPALPVDSHHHRVALRLGLIPAGTSVGRAHALLERLMPEGWDAQTVYDHHEVLMMHGQRVCLFYAPRCGVCAVRESCDAYTSGRIGQPVLESAI